MQTSARVKGSVAEATEFNRQLKSMLESREVREAMEKESCRLSDEDMAEDLHGVVEALRKGSRAGSKLDAPHRPVAPETLPPELEAMKPEMRAALRQLAVDPARTTMLIQQAALARNLTQPSQEVLDQMSEHIARVSKSVQESTALHEQLLARIPLLYGVIADSWFSEPLRDLVANSTVGQNLRGGELADHMPELFARGAAALRSLSTKDFAGEDLAVAGEQEATAHEEVGGLEWDYTLAVDTSLGFAFARDRYGFDIGLNTAGKGFLNHVRLDGEEDFWTRFAKSLALSIDVTVVSWVFDNGVGVAVTFSCVHSTDPVGCKNVGMKIKVTFGTKPTSGTKAVFTTALAVGGGLRGTFKQSQHVRDKSKWQTGLVNTFEFEAGTSTAFKMGAQFAAAYEGRQQPNEFSSLAVSSKTIYYPTSKRGYPDIAVKATGNTALEEEEPPTVEEPPTAAAAAAASPPAAPAAPAAPGSYTPPEPASSILEPPASIPASSIPKPAPKKPAPKKPAARKPWKPARGVV